MAVFAPLILFCLSLLLLAHPGPAHAWKPYTHNFSAAQIRQELVATGGVTINGKQYRVQNAIAQAIIRHPADFNAGAVGPDGFPDLAYGQSVIHPAETGQWLRYLLQQARNAQFSSNYSAVEKERILAFTYGFFMHAAGDVWGHTLINDFSQGVFPTIAEMKEEWHKAAIAVRHIVSEGIVNDATPGYDGGGGRKCIDAACSDISDDSTPSYAYNVPKRFIYETLIRQDAPTPILASRGNTQNARGPLIGHFLDRRAELQDRIMTVADPLALAVENFKLSATTVALARQYCDFTKPVNLLPPNIGLCVMYFSEVVFDIDVLTLITNPTKVFDVLAAAHLKLVADLQNAILYHDIQQIDAGLQNWPDFGLALTRALFDPQARRNLQNLSCAKFPGDQAGPSARSTCEDGVSKFDVIMHEENDFILNHLLGMVGFSDTTVSLVKDLVELGDDLGAFFDQITMGLNPVRDGIAVAKAYIGALIKARLKETLSIDIDVFDEVLKSPAPLMCNYNLPPLPGQPPGQYPQLFRQGDMTRMDQLLGFTAADHVAVPGLPPGCSRLNDNAVYNPNKFAPVKNTIMLGKLLLFDGPELNTILGDTLGRPVSTYQAGDNILFTAQAIGGVAIPSISWLKMIDGDHAWQRGKSGSNGNFPLWESCALRPAFRRLFTDWENGPVGSPAAAGKKQVAARTSPAVSRFVDLPEPDNNFPDKIDPPLRDPLNAPAPPGIALSVTGARAGKNSGYFFTDVKSLGISGMSAKYGSPDKAFKGNDLKIRYRVYTDPKAPGEYVPFTASSQIAFPLQNVFYIDTQVSDPCYPYSTEPGRTVTSLFARDVTPPVLACTPLKKGMMYDNQMIAPGSFFTADDGPFGSGAATWYATFHSTGASKGPLVYGSSQDRIPLTGLASGPQTVTITATDYMGLTSKVTCSFNLMATINGLLDVLHGVQKRQAPGAPPYLGPIINQLNAARNAQQNGQHASAQSSLQSIMNAQVPLKAGGGQDAEAAKTMQYIKATVQNILSSH